jgi:hypothetical protein
MIIIGIGIPRSHKRIGIAALYSMRLPLITRGLFKGSIERGRG